MGLIKRLDGKTDIDPYYYEDDWGLRYDGDIGLWVIMVKIGRKTVGHSTVRRKVGSVIRRLGLVVRFGGEPYWCEKTVLNPDNGLVNVGCIEVELVQPVPVLPGFRRGIF